MENKILNKRYNTLSKIGSGGMAFVYKGEDTLLNRIVAIKVLKNELQDGDEFINRFEIEAKSIAALSHPYIVSIYDIGNEDDIHYFIMEYVEGESLKEKIEREKALKWQDNEEFVLQVCEGLKHAHDKGIIHRDIKPHNILINKENIPKIADFGIAKYVTQKTVTRTGRIMGSVHYISPEQAKGQKADKRSDIYTLGITLYEMFTGELPFEGENPISVIVKHIKDEPKKVYDINRQIPKEVSKIIMKMLTKDPKKRYQCIEDVIIDFKRVIDTGHTESDVFRKTESFKDIFKIKKDKKTNKSENEEEFGYSEIKLEKEINKDVKTIKSQNKENEEDKVESSLKSKKKAATIVVFIVCLAAGILIYNIFINNEKSNNQNSNLGLSKKIVEPLKTDEKSGEEEDVKTNSENTDVEKIKGNEESKETEKIEEDNENKDSNYNNSYFKTFFTGYYSALSDAIASEKFSLVENYYVNGSSHYYEQKENVSNYVVNYAALDCTSCSISEVTKINNDTYDIKVNVSFLLTKKSGSTITSNESYVYTVNLVGEGFQISVMK